MDNKEIQDNRRARLRRLIKERYKSQADFVQITGENQGEVSGLLSTKSFGEKKARKLESKCGLPAGWFDVLDSADNLETPAAPSDQASFGPAPPWMAPEAYELLTLYYAADPDDQAEIMNTARDTRRANSEAIVHNKA